MKLKVLVAFALFATSATHAQRLSFDNVKTMYSRNSGSIYQQKEIKVYFKNSPIVHLANKEKNSMPYSGTGCRQFSETTPITEEYTVIAKGIIDQLNKGFNTTVFVFIT